MSGPSGRKSWTEFHSFAFLVSIVTDQIARLLLTLTSLEMPANKHFAQWLISYSAVPVEKCDVHLLQRRLKALTAGCFFECKNGCCCD